MLLDTPVSFEDCCLTAGVQPPLSIHLQLDLNYNNGYFQIRSLNADALNPVSIDHVPNLTARLESVETGEPFHVSLEVSFIKKDVKGPNLAGLRKVVEDTMDDFMGYLRDKLGLILSPDPIISSHYTLRRKSFYELFSTVLMFSVPFYDSRVIGAFNGVQNKQVFKMMFRRDLYVIGYRVERLIRRQPEVLTMMAVGQPKFLMTIDGHQVICWMESENFIALTSLNNKVEIQERIHNELFSQWPLDPTRVKIEKWLSNQHAATSIYHALQMEGLIA